MPSRTPLCAAGLVAVWMRREDGDLDPVPLSQRGGSFCLSFSRITSVMEGIGRTSEIVQKIGGMTKWTLSLLSSSGRKGRRASAWSISQNFGKEAALIRSAGSFRGDAVIPSMPGPPFRVADRRHARKMAEGV